MYARFLALFCLLCVSVSTGRSESIVWAGVPLEVYLKSDANVSASVIDAMKTELAALMHGAGYQLEWWDSSTQQPNPAGDLIVVSFRGECEALPAHVKAHSMEGTPSLAASSMVDGRILPFSHIDCTALSRFLESSLSIIDRTRRDYYYGRAMARLLAHEFYHVLGQTEHHTHKGIAKAEFTTADLLADRFEFEEVALERLHSK